MYKEKTKKSKLLSIALAIVVTLGAIPISMFPSAVYADTVNCSLYKDGTYYMDNFPAGNWKARVGGKVKTAYCLQPSKNPDEGSATATEMSDENRISQAMYYCKGYPGWKKLQSYAKNQSGHADWFTSDAGNGYVLCHYILACIYDKDSWEGYLSSDHVAFVKKVAAHVKSLPDPPLDSTVSIAPSNTKASWLADQTGYKSGIYKLTAHEDNYINFTVPTGMRVHNTTTSETFTAGATAEINGGDSFYITDVTVANGGTTWSSGSLPSAIGDYTPYKFNADASYQDIAFFAVDKADTTSFSVSYDRVGKIEVAKTYVQGGDVHYEAGAKFQVWNAKYDTYGEAAASSLAEAAVITTDSSGVGISPWLEAGTYIIHQIDGSDEHVFMEDRTAVISTNQETVKVYSGLGVIDNLLSVSLNVVKVDSETGKTVPVSGAKFKLKDEAGEYVEFAVRQKNPDTGRYETVIINEFETSIAGEWETPQPLTAGTYYICEMSAPYGYVLNETEKKVELKDNGENITLNAERTLASATFENAPQKGIIEATKIGKDLVLKDGEFVEGNPVTIPNVVLEIRAKEDIYSGDKVTKLYSKGEVVDTIVTSEDGKAKTKALPLGKYEIYEISVKDNVTEYSFSSDEIATATEEYKNSGADVVEFLMFASYLNAGITKTSKGNLFSGTKQIIDSQQLEIVKQLLEGKIGNEKSIDRSLDYGYVIPTDAVGEVNLTYQGEETEVFTESITLTNHVIQGKIVITKSDVSSGELLPKTKINILNDKKEVILSDVTDKNGVVEFGPLPAGTYYYQEVEAPKGYIIDNKAYEFQITEDGQVIRASMTNTKGKGTIEVSTKDNNKNGGGMYYAVQTGDDTKLFGPVLLLLAALVTMCIALSRKKKRGDDVDEQED